MSNIYVKDYLNIVGHREGCLWIRMRPLAHWLSGVRSIEGRRWYPDQKEWSIPGTEPSVRRFVTLFKNEPVIVEDYVLAIFPMLRIARKEGHGVKDCNKK